MTTRQLYDDPNPRQEASAPVVALATWPRIGVSVLGTLKWQHGVFQEGLKLGMLLKHMAPS